MVSDLDLIGVSRGVFLLTNLSDLFVLRKRDALTKMVLIGVFLIKYKWKYIHFKQISLSFAI